MVQAAEGRPAKGRTPRRKPRSLSIPGTQDPAGLQARLLDLEGRVRALAISRRVLISLLISSDKKRKTEVTRLRAEVERLRQRNQVRARAIAARDAVISRLRYQLAELTGEVGADGAPPGGPAAATPGQADQS